MGLRRRKLGCTLAPPCISGWGWGDVYKREGAGLKTEANWLANLWVPLREKAWS